MFDPTFRTSYIFASLVTFSLMSADMLCHASPQADEPAEAPAEAPVEASTEATTQQTRDLDMALHYILIGNPEGAQASIQSLFDSGITDEQIANLVEARGISDKVDRAFSRGRGMEGADVLVAELESRYLAGTRATSRSALRIEAAVAALGGSMRQEMVARAKLMRAGAFAVHALLNALGDARNPKLANSARSVLVDLKRLAVAPLCAALPDLEVDTQRQVCEILAEIGYPSSQAYLLGLATNPAAADDVRAAALRAYARLGGTSQDPASQYTALARRYFDQAPSLIPYPADARNAIWSYGATNGLVGIEIPTPLYCETMAIQSAMKALELDPDSEQALAIYVASDLRRSMFLRLLEIDVASESEESSMFASRYSAQFFGTASGARIAQMALGFAIDASDVLLARECIRVLSTNGGATTLVAPLSGRSPIVECLLFADRRVRFEAAIVLASSLPQSSFQQDSLVVPVLASMIQMGGMTGAVIATTEEDRQALAARLGSLGISTVTTGASMSEIEGKLAPGVTMDLVVLQGSHASMVDSVNGIRLARSTATSPVVIIANGGDAEAFSIEFENDPRVSVFASIATEEQFVMAIDSAVGAAGGIAVTPEESAIYLDESLNALRRLAESSNLILDVRVAEATLIGTLQSSTGEVQSKVARVLALLPGATAQRSLMNAALSASEEDRATLLSSVATSARKYGNLLDASQIQSLQALIQSSTGPIADAAGQAFGALELPTSEVVKLILAPKS